MTHAIGVVMDPIHAINFKKDTTLALMLAARERGWTLYYMEQKDLAIVDGRAMGNMAPVEVFDDPARWFSLGAREERPLADLDAILMRKDPPFDSEFIYSTYILEAAEREGVLVVNRPQSLRDCNEKVFATLFPRFTPPLLVSRDPMRLRKFHATVGEVIFKPLDGMGGAAIFLVKPGDANLSVIIETLTHHGTRTIMAQKYIPEITAGDKRILMVDGEPVPYCLARIPASGESRGNLAAGGRGVVQPLSPRDREIAEAIGPVLRDKGILFAGLDVIGDYLTEINVTSPTCAREIDAAEGTRIGPRLMDAIARRLG
ncbi:MAG: glutathione synthase [Porticoccaceae bacterium]|jgi:glutathione synthase|nr:glutathione synthase [Porticoccaceae bacterium]